MQAEEFYLILPSAHLEALPDLLVCPWQDDPEVNLHAPVVITRRADLQANLQRHFAEHLEALFDREECLKPVSGLLARGGAHPYPGAHFELEPAYNASQHVVL